MGPRRDICRFGTDIVSRQADDGSSSGPSEDVPALGLTPTVDDLTGPATAEQLAEVMDGADEVPLGIGLLLPSQAEAAEAHGLLDPAEDRLDDGLAPSVVVTTLLRPELVLHASATAEVLGDAAQGRWSRCCG